MSEQDRLLGRRALLGNAGAMALGMIGLESLLGRSAFAQDSSQALPHFAPKAKRVLFMTQSGGPSQIELFDPKPGLARFAGQELPASVRDGQRVTGMTKGKPQLIMPSVTRFRRRGQSGIEFSDWLPHLGSIVDELCVVRSMVTDQINHAPAMTRFLTGHQLPGRPSLGSWVSYGLGAESDELPAYVALISKMKRGSDQPLYDHYWGNGFLPSAHQGVRLRSAAEPVLYLSDPKGVSRELRRAQLDTLAGLNSERLRLTGDPEIGARIEQYEMAFRMQLSVPELTDLSNEPEEVFNLYGGDSRRPGTYASNCLLARRMLERGVRFVQLFHPDWDHHSRLKSWCRARCRDTDQASTALILDLKRRGLLEDTLVVWGGEFGRSVAGQGDWQSPEAGRDHHPRCFTVLLAGAGIRPGMTYGATDDFSFNVVENPVQVRDLHATILHLLGIDHERFRVRHRGLDMRLTGVEHARVVTEILT
ncbi:MAG: hypothetical protein ACI8QS_001121 [Planctomycetota bacterium]|jgi:hypothetical protein